MLGPNCSSHQRDAGACYAPYTSDPRRSLPVLEVEKPTHPEEPAWRHQAGESKKLAIGEPGSLG